MNDVFRELDRVDLGHRDVEVLPVERESAGLVVMQRGGHRHPEPVAELPCDPAQLPRLVEWPSVGDDVSGGEELELRCDRALDLSIESEPVAWGPVDGDPRSRHDLSRKAGA